MGKDATDEPDWLSVRESAVVFEGDVIPLLEDATSTNVPMSFDVQRAGWNRDPGPDTWLGSDVLPRFAGHRVRVTVEDLGPSPLIDSRWRNPKA